MAIRTFSTIFSVGRNRAGRYVLVDLLGSGGMGTVWRAWDSRTKRFVAAKVLRQADSTHLLRFVRESFLRLDHPHVLAPTAWAAEDDRVLFVMDLVAGGSVAQLIDDYGPLPPACTALLLDQLLDAVGCRRGDWAVWRRCSRHRGRRGGAGLGDLPHRRLSRSLLHCSSSRPNWMYLRQDALLGIVATSAATLFF